MTRRWTKPYYGVTHMEDAPDRTQITVSSHETFSCVYMLRFNDPNPFTNAQERYVYGTGHEERAKEVGEQWAEIETRTY